MEEQVTDLWCVLLFVFWVFNLVCDDLSLQVFDDSVLFLDECLLFLELCQLLWCGSSNGE